MRSIVDALTATTFSRTPGVESESRREPALGDGWIDVYVGGNWTAARQKGPRQAGFSFGLGLDSYFTQPCIAWKLRSRLICDRRTANAYTRRDGDRL